MQLAITLFESECSEMAKIDVLEERLSNHIKFFWRICAGIIIALGYIAYSLYQINGRLSNVDGLEGRVTTAELKSQAALPIADFQKSLPDLKSAVISARKSGITISPAVISDIQNKLQATPPTATDFWPTVSEFVSYRSAFSVSDIQKLKSLPNCKGPYIDAFSQGITKEGTPVGPQIPTKIEERDCKLILDNIEAGHMTYTNCFVEYSGGPIKRLDDVTFQNCVFEFSIPSSPPPPPEGARIGETLLASNDLSSVHLP
jgi:hypothetical protein